MPEPSPELGVACRRHHLFGQIQPLVDGLRDAGVLKNDTRGFVVYGPCTEARAGSEGPGILLTIESLEASE